MRSVFLLGLLFRGIWSLDLGGPKTNELGRRNLLKKVAGSIAAGTLAAWVDPLQVMALETPYNDDIFQAYRIVPDASSKLNPRIKKVQVRAAGYISCSPHFDVTIYMTD
jgi:hypothetical protein